MNEFWEEYGAAPLFWRKNTYSNEELPVIGMEQDDDDDDDANLVICWQIV